jgi:RecG-like helicase
MFPILKFLFYTVFPSVQQQGKMAVTNAKNKHSAIYEMWAEYFNKLLKRRMKESENSIMYIYSINSFTCDVG